MTIAAFPSAMVYLAELRRRSAEIKAGAAELTPWAEVKRRARARVEARLRG